MPTFRGRFVPQIESTGRPKKCMDILLWGANWKSQSQPTKKIQPVWPENFSRRVVPGLWRTENFPKPLSFNGNPSVPKRAAPS